MNNVQGNVKVCRKFDLKGATYNRRARPKKLTKDNAISPQNKLENIVYKDEDFLEIERTLQLAEEDRDALVRRVSDAVELLNHAQIIDYSLLIIKFDKIDTIGIPAMYLYKSTVENEMYSISIIDMLQQFGLKRIIERNVKGLFAERASQVGAQSPEVYASRLVKFLENILPKEAE
jgi:Phosphatidylinositol-4-phosphate 5-Kinase